MMPSSSPSDTLTLHEQQQQQVVLTNNNNIIPPLTREQVFQCQFSSWYGRFENIIKSSAARRTNYTIKSVIIHDLPSNFTDYLLEDGVILPKGATTLSSLVSNCRNNNNSDSDEWSCSDTCSDNEEENESQENNNNDSGSFHFPLLNQQIQQAIQLLGGSIVPKLNWSCPRDAVWINENSLKCTTVGDVYLLLKSSDFVLHDVLYAYNGIVEENNNESGDTNAQQQQQHSLELVLRKWCNLHPSMEFRCFVWDKQLLAISQRNHTQHFEHLVKNQQEIKSTISTFHTEIIQSRFPLQNYSFDVYIDKQERVWVLDFNVWHTRTDSLLFTWSELMEMTSHPREFVMIRVVETNELSVLPLASYRAPMDAIHYLASSTTQLEEFMKLCKKPSEVYCDDEEEDNEGELE